MARLLIETVTRTVESAVGGWALSPHFPDEAVAMPAAGSPP